MDRGGRRGPQGNERENIEKRMGNKLTNFFFATTI